MTPTAVKEKEKGTQARFQLGMVAVRKCAIDPKYQRDVSPKFVAQLVENWNDEAVGVIYVLQQGGTYYILDGQHRWEASKALGIEEIPALIYQGLTAAEAAGLFVYFNRDRRGPHTVDVFRASVAQGDPDSIEITAAIRAVGYQIRNVRGSFTATSTAAWVYRTCGKEVLLAILKTLHDAWPMDVRGATNAELIKGIAIAYLYHVRAHGDFWDWDVLKAALAKTTFSDLSSVVRSRVSPAILTPKNTLWAFVVAESYQIAFGRHRRGKLDLPSNSSAYRHYGRVKREADR